MSRLAGMKFTMKVGGDCVCFSNFIALTGALYFIMLHNSSAMAPSFSVLDAEASRVRV